MSAAGTKSQGIKVYIGTKLADPTTDTFTQIKRCKVVGEFGGQAKVIDATAYEDNAMQKLKGIPDNGDVQLGGNRVFTDAGQNALKAASIDTDDTPYNLRIEIPNAGASGATLRYSFKALVTKFRDKPGSGTESLIEYDGQVAITGAITEATV